MAEKTIRDKLSENIVKGFDQATSVVGSHTREIMGSALGGLIDDVKNLAKSSWNIISGTAISMFNVSKSLFGLKKRNIDEEQLDENKEQTSILKSIKGIFKRQEKKDARKIVKKEKGFMDLIGVPIAVITGLLIGYLSQALKPLKSLSGLIKVTIMKPLKGISKLFGKIFPDSITKIFSKEGVLGKLFGKIFPDSITKIFSKEGVLGKLFGKINNIWLKIVDKFKLLSTGDGLFGTIFRFAKKLGSFFFWVRLGWDTVKELLSGKSIRDKILGVSASILSLVAEIPELIINGILWLFKSNFRVDFSKESIINATNKITDWVFDNVTMPTVKFITETVPKFLTMVVTNIKNFIGSLWMNTVEMFDSLTTKIETIWSNIKNWFTEKLQSLNPANWLDKLNVDTDTISLENLFKSLTNIGEIIREKLVSAIRPILSKMPDWMLPESLEGLKNETTVQLPKPDTINNDTTNLNTVKISDEETKRSNILLEQLLEQMKQVNSNGKKTNAVSTTVAQQNVQNNTQNTEKNDLPVENEYLGIGLMNSTI